MAVGEVLTLVLYLVQQLGVMLGVGAATIMLIAHLVATRDGVVEESEARFARAIERVLMIGLFGIISSGVFITALHSTAGEAVIIFTPAFVFKWLLIGVVTLPLIIGHRHPFPPLQFEGFIGGTWFALFMLHIVAPIATWTALLLLYAIWMVLFFIVWSVLVHVLHARDSAGAGLKPIPAPAPALATAGGPPIQKTHHHKPLNLPSLSMPSVALPNFKPLVSSIFAAPAKPVTPVVVKPQEPVVVKPAPPPAKPAAPAVTVLPQAPAPTKPVLAAPLKPPIKPAPQKPQDQPVEYFGLPAIRVMPRTVEDIQKQDRAAVVQSN